MARGKRQKKSPVARIVLTAAAALAGIAVAAGVCTGVYVQSLDTVYPNISVSGIPIGGLTFDQAHNVMLNSNLKLANEMKVKVIFTDDVSVELSGSDVGYAESVTDLANMAVNYGKDGNVVENTITYIKCLSNPVELSTAGEFDGELVRQRVSEAAAKVNKGSTDAGYTIGETEITVKKGEAGYHVDEDAVYNYIARMFEENTRGTFETDQFAESSVIGANGQINLDAIFGQVNVEPVNAAYDAETCGVIPGKNGITFDLEDAKRKYNALNDGDMLTIPLVTVEPEIKDEDVESLLFRDCLAKKNTTLSTSSSNRINNVTLAAAAINDLVLKPGDEFSFNGTVGERTTEKGYKPAGAYVGGESVDQVGGGICQVSSTIYYCVLKANLETTRRSNHMFSVAYLPLGFDATVNWGTLDFRFKNNQEYPVKLVAYVENKQLYVEIWGTKLDDTYVELQYNLIETLEYSVVEKEDETIAPGTSKVKTSGHKGYIVDSYQLIYDGDGTLLEKNYLARNKYKTQDRVILIPPKSEEAVDDPVIGGNTDPEDPVITDPVTPETPETPETPGPEITDPETPGPETPDPVTPEITDPETPDPVTPDPVPETPVETEDGNAPQTPEGTGE